MMQFDIEQAKAVLQRTPGSFHALLHGLDDEWTQNNEGGNSWSVGKVVAHLVYCDRFNWLARAKRLLQTSTAIPFDPLDAARGVGQGDGKSLPELLRDFRQTRTAVLQELDELGIGAGSYGARGLHPDFGEVRLSQLLSAWVVHDLSHLSQSCRIMATQYREAVGPWIAYLRILN